MYGLFALPSPPDIRLQDLRDTEGRTALVLSTLLLFKLPGLSEPLTFQTFELEPFQLLGERAQPHKQESPVTL